jgi:hypothetical protein
MAKVFGLFRNAVFLGWLSVALASTTLAAGVWAFQMTTTIAAMSAKAASTAVAHREQLAKAVAKAKAKARLQRAVVAVPIAGVAAIGYFEEQDYQEWLAAHPDGTRKQYGCEVASLTAEVVDDVLQGLPEIMRPEPELVLNRLPECENE